MANRSYNLKKSPINKGTAAKPSPMKDFGLISGPLIAAALTKAALAKAAITAGVGAAVSGGIGAISKGVAGKKQSKAQAKSEAQQRRAAATASTGKKEIGTGSKIV